MNKISKSEKLFRGFRIATMDCAVATSYGMLDAHSIGVSNGKIDWVLPDAKIAGLELNETEVVDGAGKLLTPGLIDCHTHLVYGGNRADEWARRLAGESYESIAHQGGGILSSVHATRAANEESLFKSAKTRLQCLIREGVTTVEIKSGYGLDLDSELKMLRVANRLGEELDVDVESTLLAAHAVPPEFKGRAGEYVDLVCNEIMPAAKRSCSAVDVFCESIAFDLTASKRVLETAAGMGLKTKIHAEQLTRTGSAVMAAQIGALSADHLEYLSESDCQTMADTEIVATLLPGAFYCLQEKQKPPVQALLKHNVPIAIATDSNPGSSPIESLLLVANMACNLFGLTAEQAFAGITRNAAQALGLLESRGTVEAGKVADFAVWQAETPAEFLYALGGQPCVASFKGGNQVLWNE